MYFLCCSMYFCVVLCIVCYVLCIICVHMCTELLPPGGYPIAVKYIISYRIINEVRQTVDTLLPGPVNDTHTHKRHCSPHRAVRTPEIQNLPHEKHTAYSSQPFRQIACLSQNPTDAHCAGKVQSAWWYTQLSLWSKRLTLAQPGDLARSTNWQMQINMTSSRRLHKLATLYVCNISIATQLVPVPLRHVVYFPWHNTVSTNAVSTFPPKLRTSEGAYILYMLPGFVRLSF